MSDAMQEIRASFFVECEELLEAMQDGLETMSQGEPDDETINVVFRAVHSIKGGAGAFGLEELVSFAHIFETALDEVRAGRLDADADAMRLFFQGGDILQDLVAAARDDTPSDEARAGPVREALIAIVGEEAAAAEEEDDGGFAPMTLSLDLGDLGDGPAESEAIAGIEAPALPEAGGPALSGPAEALGASALAADEHAFRIRFTPTPELFQSGNEPLFLFRALQDLGRLQVLCEAEALPPLDDYTPEQLLLSWELRLITNADATQIDEVFEFVDGLCTLAVEDLPASEIDFPDPDPPADPIGPPPPSPPDGGGGAAPGMGAPPDSFPTSPAGPAATGLTEGDLPPPSGETPDNIVALTPAAAAPPAPPPKRPATGGSGAGGSGGATPTRATVRVDLERIDRLVNLVGELVINQAMLSQSVAEAGLSSNTQVSSGLDEFLQLTRDIQESVMMIRAQPVKSMFQRMARIVRESSNDVGKTVRFVTEGEATEIDKTVIERLADPLTHMIRNAVDHGLESAESRLAAGKPAEGVITLSAAHRSGRVVIEVADDGGGINRPKVKSIAEEKGLIQPDQPLSDTEIDNLLFLPGFSTANEVSNLSGRGVGMDVVKSAISALGGRITITSEPGAGTTFSISLPLTLAVLDGMVVRVAGETLVMPLNTIGETLSLNEEDVRPLGPETQVIRVRDIFVPLLDLGAELGYRTPIEDYTGAIVLLISQEDGAEAALVVDSIEDQRQVVIKGMQDSYGRVPGVAAATILGDGQIALILDPADLVANASGRSRPPSAPAPSPTPALTATG